MYLKFTKKLLKNKNRRDPCPALAHCLPASTSVSFSGARTRLHLSWCQAHLLKDAIHTSTSACSHTSYLTPFLWHRHCLTCCILYLFLCLSSVFSQENINVMRAKIFLIGSRLSPQHLAQWLAHSRCSIRTA